MSTKVIDSKTILAVSNVVPGGWDAYDWYKRNSSGGNTPYALRRQGTYTENDYTSTIQFERSDVSKVSFYPGGPYTTILGTKNIGGTPVPVDTAMAYPDVYDRVLPGLYNKWRQSKAECGVTFGEGREGLEMIAQRLKGMTLAARSLYRRNIGGALRNLLGQVPPSHRRRMRSRMDAGDLSGAWLEGHLGWSPMFQDIYNAWETLQPKERKNRIRHSAVNKCAMRSSGDFASWYVDGSCEKWSVLICDFSKEIPVNWRDTWGLTNPAGVAWELTRLSFVADWFLPIGRALDSFHAMGRLKPSQVIQVHFEKTIGKSTVVRSPVAGVYHNGHIGHGVTRNFVTNRTINSSLHSVVSATAWLPLNVTPKWEPSAWKVTTGVALLHQALQKLR